MIEGNGLPPAVRMTRKGEGHPRGGAPICENWEGTSAQLRAISVSMQGIDND
jgi:hypothetical protein